jgi:hypothetical protein
MLTSSDERPLGWHWSSVSSDDVESFRQRRFCILQQSLERPGTVYSHRQNSEPIERKLP